ncbi:zinc finger protein 311 [Anabrus simplex]|uniref:zinc finger protein 311 n=1 Tax=Anabrus simplex TaxID=316456 RepID=UPI0035A2830C
MEYPAFVRCEPGCLWDTEEDIKCETKVENPLDIKTEPYSLLLGAAIKGETSDRQEGDILRKLLTKEGEINEHKAIPQVWVKQEIKEERKVQPEISPDSSDECMAENESLRNGNEGNNEEETELQDVKSVCEAKREREPSASDEQAPLEFLRMKYCCRQSMILGKNCDICNKPMVKDCCRESMLLGKNCSICKKSTVDDTPNFVLLSREQDPSASDEQASLEFLKMKYCCKKNMLLGKDCDICNRPMVKNCCRQNMLLGKDCDICNKPVVKKCCRKSMLLGKSCDICKKPTDPRNILYWCKFCDTGYTNRYRLQTHLIVHRDKNFQCNICLKLFLNQHNLDKHKQSKHCGEKTCLCPTCGKGFRGKFALKRHIIVHSAKRDYQCSLCNKSFKMREHLVNHKQLVHGGERNCLCPTCGKGFKTNFVLRRHLVSHSSE